MHGDNARAEYIHFIKRIKELIALTDDGAMRELSLGETKKIRRHC